MPRVRLMAGVVLAAGMLLPAFVQPQPAAAASANVAALQAALRSLGYYGAAVDGVSGPLTRSAVLSFQRRRGLAVDGIAGPATRSALGRRGRPALGSRTMRRGMRGWDVAALQYLLARRGYPPGAIDGAFGPITGTAVRNYQSRAGLSVDELAGSATISSLRRGSRSGSGTQTPSGPVRFLRPVPGPIGRWLRRPARWWPPAPQRDRLPRAVRHARRRRGRGRDRVRGPEPGRLRQPRGDPPPSRLHHLVRALSSITTYVGESVSGGTRIGYVGSTGNSTGPHLHFEARRFGTPIDPLPYLLSTVAARAARARARAAPAARRGHCSKRQLLVNYRRERPGCRAAR